LAGEAPVVVVTGGAGVVTTGAGVVTGGDVGAGDAGVAGDAGAEPPDVVPPGVAAAGVPAGAAVPATGWVTPTLPGVPAGCEVVPTLPVLVAADPPVDPGVVDPGAAGAPGAAPATVTVGEPVVPSSSWVVESIEALSWAMVC
jgi:hypothetical protein